jgi:hypothetical protein
MTLPANYELDCHETEKFQMQLKILPYSQFIHIYVSYFCVE